MVTVKAGCPFCGQVNLQPTDIDLRIGNDTATYAFTCPNCRNRIVKPADMAVLDLLGQAGVRPRSMDRNIPAEAMELKTGPPLSYDNLLDFMAELAATDFLAADRGLPCS